MNDIAAVLSAAARDLDLPAVGDGTAQADLARGRAALARGRARRAATRSVLVLGVAGALTVGAGGLHLPGPTATPPARAATLAGYTGPQPDSFRVDVVPTGWTVLKADASTLLIGPSGAALDDGSDGMTQVEGDLYVKSVSAGDPLPDLAPVKVGATTGYWGTYVDSDTHGLTVPVGSHTLQIQVPATLHWTATDAAAFARGLHLPERPVTTHG